MASNLNNRKNSGYIIAGVGAIFLAIILFSQLSQNPTQYFRQVQADRDAKDLQFTNDPNSPIPKTERRDFQGLSYFPIEKSYQVRATLLEATNADTLTLMTSSGSDYQVVVAGKLRFFLQGHNHELTAYTHLEGEPNGYFIPFSDLTSGVSTYGGGRYLDIPQAQELMIDFNLAYHPYCVYNETFICPLPPPENDLALEIRAGERMPDESGQ